VSVSTSSTPFISIGVTTFNQQTLLKKTLLSILAQTYSDYEVIIGNDFVDEPLSLDLLGISDARFRVINHPANLGEIGNSNALLAEARAPYFTWQTQDDVYHPEYLEEMHGVLTGPETPFCVYSDFAFIVGNENVSEGGGEVVRQNSVISGRQFLRNHLSGEKRALGCMGAYRTDYLRELGGVQQLSGSQYAIYSEHLLLHQAGLLSHVGYVPRMLVGYRVHPASWGYATADVYTYMTAAQYFLIESLGIFGSADLREDFGENIRSVLRRIFTDVFQRGTMKRGLHGRFLVLPFIFTIRKELRKIEDSSLRLFAANAWRSEGRRILIRMVTEFGTIRTADYRQELG
jgi:glycosyltransferase involved in cell wall biosynthesis